MQAADYFDKNDDNYTKRPSDGTHVSNLNGDNECIESVPEKEYDDENPPPLFPNDWYNEHIHQPMVALVNNQNFQMCIIGLIIVNSALMGVATFKFVENDQGVTDAFAIVDEIILSAFTAELGLNLVVYHKTFFNDAWRCFDALTIAMSYLLGGAKIIRSFRIFRAFRLFGRIPALKKILFALFSTGDQMVSIFFVLSLFYYIFAVMFTQLFGDCDEYECFGDDINYFGSLHQTIMTLFILMNMEDWANLTRQTQKRHSWAWFPVIVFIMVSSFIMLNLIIAVLCEALSKIKEEKDVKEVKEDLVRSSSRLSQGIPLQGLEPEKLSAQSTQDDGVETQEQIRSRNDKMRKDSTDELKKKIESLRTKLRTVTGLKQQQSFIVNRPNIQTQFDDMKAESVPNWQTLSEFPVPGCCYTHKM